MSKHVVFEGHAPHKGSLLTRRFKRSKKDEPTTITTTLSTTTTKGQPGNWLLIFPKGHSTEARNFVLERLQARNLAVTIHTKGEICKAEVTGDISELRIFQKKFRWFSDRWTQQTPEARWTQAQLTQAVWWTIQMEEVDEYAWKQLLFACLGGRNTSEEQTDKKKLKDKDKKKLKEREKKKKIEESASEEKERKKLSGNNTIEEKELKGILKKVPPPIGGKPFIEHEPLINACIRIGIISEVLPLHDEVPYAQLKKYYTSSFTDLLSPRPSPEDFLSPAEARAYFGEAIGFYLAWMKNYIFWLSFPALLGLLVTIIRLLLWQTLEESPVIPIYSLFVVLGSFVFIRLWDRSQAQLAFSWHVFKMDKRQRVRPGFYGELKTSPVTGRLQRYYHPWKRTLKQLASLCVSIALLCFAFGIMICSLNLQGYVRREDSPIHIDWLHDFAHPGAIFDPNGYIFSLIPVLLHVVVIAILNKFYSYVAVCLTNWENYRTEEQHEYAIVIKRFFFEAIDCYMPLFYIAFFQEDVVMLRQELVSLFTMDELRRVSIELLIPSLFLYFFKRKYKTTETEEDTSDDKKSEDSPLSRWDMLEIQEKQPEHELFDEYLEMVIQFGYIIMFASCFPLGPVIAIITNVLELRSDIFKLCRVCRRPFPRRVPSIGVWQHLLLGLCWMSIITNVWIFGFGSDQLSWWFPQLFQRSDSLTSTIFHHHTEAKQGMGRYACGIVSIAEHIIALAAVALLYFFPAIPANVKLAVQRAKWLKTQSDD